jgi:DNA-binding Xre family transcriptional regulator
MGEKSMAGLKFMRVRLLIREICEDRKITRTWLSHHAEVQYDTISGIWKNPNRDVSIVTLLKIAHALNVDVSELYEVEPE